MIEISQRLVNTLERMLHRDAASAVVKEDRSDITERTVDEGARQDETPLLIKVMLHLAENERTACQVLARIEGTRIVAISVEEVQEDSFARHELEEALVEIDFTENVELAYLLDREKTLSLFGFEHNGVLMTSQTAGREDVNRLHELDPRFRPRLRGARSVVGSSSETQQNS